MQRLTLDPKNFKENGFKSRRDPLTHEPFKVGDSVVICSRCGAASLSTSWAAIGGACACQGAQQSIELSLGRRDRQHQQTNDGPNWLTAGITVAAIIVGLAVFPKYINNTFCKFVSCEAAVRQSSSIEVDDAITAQNNALLMTKQEQLHLAQFGLTLGSPGPTAASASHGTDQKPVVVDVNSTSPLHARGVKIGMVLKKVAGVDVNSLASAGHLISKFNKTTQDSIELQFGGPYGQCRTSVPSDQRQRRPQADESWLGVTLSDGNAGGVMVRALSRNLPIDLNGLRPRDRIVSVDCAQVRSVGQVNRMFGEIGSGVVLALKVLRDGKTKFLRTVTIDQIQTAALNSNNLLFQDHFDQMIWWLDELGLSSTATDPNLALEQRLRTIFRSQSDPGFPLNLSLTWGALFVEMQKEIDAKRKGSVERFAIEHDVTELRVMSILDQIARHYWTIPSGESFVAAVGASSHFIDTPSPACRKLSAGLEKGKKPVEARICKRRTAASSSERSNLFIYSE